MYSNLPLVFILYYIFVYALLTAYLTLASLYLFLTCVLKIALLQMLQYCFGYYPKFIIHITVFNLVLFTTFSNY